VANGEQKKPSTLITTLNPQLNFTHLRFTLYAQLATLNAQLTTRNLFSLSRPNLFVADATPTSIISVCRSEFPLRQDEITHHALRFQLSTHFRG